VYYYYHYIYIYYLCIWVYTSNMKLLISTGMIYLFAYIYTLYMYGNVLLTPWSSPRMLGLGAPRGPKLGALGLTKPPEDSASCWGFSWVRVSEMYQEKHNIGFCTAKNTPVLCWWRHQIFFFVSHFLLRIQLYIYICKSSTGIGMIPCAVCWTAHIH